MFLHLSCLNDNWHGWLFYQNKFIKYYLLLLLTNNQHVIFGAKKVKFLVNLGVYKSLYTWLVPKPHCMNRGQSEWKSKCTKLNNFERDGARGFFPRISWKIAETDFSFNMSSCNVNPINQFDQGYFWGTETSKNPWIFKANFIFDI